MKIKDCAIVSTRWLIYNVSERGETDQENGRNWTKAGYWEGGGGLLIIVQGQQEEGGSEIISCRLKVIIFQGCCQCSKLPVPEVPWSGTLDLWLYWHQEVSIVLLTWLLLACIFSPFWSVIYSSRATRPATQVLEYLNKFVICRYVQRDSRTTVMKRKTETPKEDAKKAKKDDSSSGRPEILSSFH